MYYTYIVVRDSIILTCTGCWITLASGVMARIAKLLGGIYVLYIHSGEGQYRIDLHWLLDHTGLWGHG